MQVLVVDRETKNIEEVKVSGALGSVNSIVAMLYAMKMSK
jgi:hypothetical protein